MQILERGKQSNYTSLSKANKMFYKIAIRYQYYETFFFARAFVYGKPFQTSLIIVGTVRNLI